MLGRSCAWIPPSLCVPGGQESEQGTEDGEVGGAPFVPVLTLRIGSGLHVAPQLAEALCFNVTLVSVSAAILAAGRIVFNDGNDPSCARVRPGDEKGNA